MYALEIINNVRVNNMEVPNISGGFGQGKKAMLVMHIAKIHEKEVKFVNQIINNNRDRFKNSIDIIDVKQVGQDNLFLEAGVLTKAQIGNSKNIYLLSERGYAKLIKLFNDDKSWDLYDIMLDEYFDMRNGNAVPVNNKPMSPAEMLVVYAQQFLEQEQRLNEVEQRSREVGNKVVEMKSYLVESPDFKDVEREINKYARRNNMTPNDVRTMIYQKVEDIYGINVMQRAKNGRKKIQEEREKEGKKLYAESTLKGKYTGMDVIRDEGMEKAMLEILAGFD